MYTSKRPGGGGSLTTLTTKGDILGYSGSALGRLAVGTDGQILSADAASALGIKWIAAPSGVTEGGSISGGTALRLLRSDGSGNVDSFDFARIDGANSWTAFGNQAVRDAGSDTGNAGNIGVVQAVGNANERTFVYAYNGSNGTAAGAGFAAHTSSGPILRILAIANGGSAFSFLGSSAAGNSVFASDSATCFVTTAAVDMKFGANDALAYTIKGDGTGTRFAKAVAYTPTELTGAGIAATSGVGVPSVWFSTPGANRDHTMVARSSVPKGYRVSYFMDGSAGGFTVRVLANGADTIRQGTQTLTDNGFVELMAVGTTEWTVVGAQP
jgi:hypothetical protein